ncbi:AAA family ATPase [Acidovorax sp. CCYZU-2555]|nr:AAA family ATPase [Acidovorax sp. CCYZU-2555]
MESRRSSRPAIESVEQRSLLDQLEPAQANFSLPPQIADLVFQMPVRRRLSDLVLATETLDEIQELLYEYSQVGKLRNHSLDPRHTVLLVGPPGNGKTSLVEVLASELSLPLLAVRYDAIVDSYLGETSTRIRMLIDFATRTPCVLFFDEFDAIGKERSDNQETGEIKRVVSSLLMQMDRLPSHAIIACATNHPEMLDRAVWRRFQVRLEVFAPGRQELKTWYEKFMDSLGNRSALSFEKFARAMSGRSMAEIEQFMLDVKRKLVLFGDRLDALQAVEQVLKRMRNQPGITVPDEETNARLSSGSSQPRARKTRKIAGKAPPDLP